MKKLLLLPAMLLAGFLGAQTTYVAPWQDVNMFNSTSKIGGEQVIADPSNGDLFVVGTFEQQIVIGTYTLTATEGKDIFVAKYSGGSGAVVKAIKIGGDGDDIGYTLCLRDNYIFVGCSENGVGMIYKLNNTTPLGIVFGRELGYDVRPYSLFTYGSTGKMLIGGSYSESCSLPKSSGTIDLEATNYYSEDCSGGCRESFAGMIDVNAYFLFAKHPENTTASNEIKSIWCRNGYIYCTGYFRGDMKWSSTSTTVTAQGMQDVFFASILITTSFNQLTYVNNFIQAGNDDDDSGFLECGNGICANGTAVYVTGGLSVEGSNPVFGSTTYDRAGAFIARINYNGSILGSVSWVRESEHTSGSASEIAVGYGIAVDALGNVFATGSCLDDARFEGGSNSPITISNVAASPGFIARYNPSGDILSAHGVNQAAGSGSITEGHSITTFNCDVYVTGWSQEKPFAAGNLTPENIDLSKTAMIIFDISRDAQIGIDQTYCEACASFPNTLSMYASGGTSYSWSPTTNLTSPFNPNTNYSLTSCSNSGTTNYVCTISNSVTGCHTSASVSITAGSSAVSVANAGADFDVCADDVVTMGTNMPDGLTYDWFPQYYLGSTWNQDQPTFTTPSTGLPSAISYTLTVTDVCGNVSYDYITVSPKLGCPHRMMNPNQPSARVFPNPSEGLFTVNMDFTETDELVEFTVTDLTGRTIQQNSFTTAGGQHTIDLSTQAKGVYMLTVTRNGVSEVHQLVVQ